MKRGKIKSNFTQKEIVGRIINQNRKVRPNQDNEQSIEDVIEQINRTFQTAVPKDLKLKTEQSRKRGRGKKGILEPIN